MHLVAISLAFVLETSTAFGVTPTTAVQQLALLRSSGLNSDLVSAIAARDRVRVIVNFAAPRTRRRNGADHENAAAVDSILRTLPTGRFNLRHWFRHSAVFSGSIDSVGLLALLRHPLVLRIDLEDGGRGALDEAVPLVGLDTVQTMGFTGAGITVALLDTGIDLDHPDLELSVAGEHCTCTSCCPDGSSEQQGPGSAEDDNGHGTNIAGIITSDGGVAPLGGAPDADLVIVKVLDRDNVFCCASDVIAGLEWIIDQRPDVDIVNLSLGTNLLYAGECDDVNATTMAFAGAIDTLTSRGVVVLAASQNDGSGTEMSAPACVASAIAVAASDDFDSVYAQSNTNAQTDLLAPGVSILSTGPGAGTLSLTGTSQATALSSACVASLFEANPTATGGQIESALVSSTTTIVDPKNGLGFPRLDCFEALVALPEPDRSWLLVAALGTLGVLARRARRHDSKVLLRSHSDGIS